MGYVTWMDGRIWKENAMFANLPYRRILGPSRTVCIKLYDLLASNKKNKQNQMLAVLEYL